MRQNKSHDPSHPFNRAKGSGQLVSQGAEFLSHFFPLLAIPQEVISCTIETLPFELIFSFSTTTLGDPLPIDVPLVKKPLMGTARQWLFSVLKVVFHAVAVISEVLHLSSKSRCSVATCKSLPWPCSAFLADFLSPEQLLPLCLPTLSVLPPFCSFSRTF